MYIPTQEFNLTQGPGATFLSGGEIRIAAFI
jgi:hypothetical protein